MKRCVIAILFIAAATSLPAQIDGASELFRTLKTRDSLLFAVGFNTCDVGQFENLVSDDFEFYHDQAGVTSSKAGFIAGIRDGLCRLPYRPRRELDENSLEVHPLRKNGTLYGAIQTGTHRFYAVEEGKPEHLTSIAKFTHVWLLEHGAWKLSRGLSYDHQESRIAENSMAPDDSLLFTDEEATERWLLSNRIPTLGVGYIADGEVREARVYGVLEQGRQAPDNTIFNVASLTKPVTAIVTLKLVDAGKWSLDEPICRYWTDPDIAGDPRLRQLTTRHILSHRSGFPNWRRESPDGKLAFQFSPGARYQYSGEGFEYLRRALERTFHTTLDRLAAELVFEPLGMHDTRFSWDSTIDETRFARWHDANGELYETYRNTSANAADDLLTTIGDYTRFMAYIAKGAGLSRKLYDQMASVQARVKSNKYFGLGWWVDEKVDDGAHALAHGGDDRGVHTIAFILPQSKRGLVIFTNSDNGTETYRPLLRHYLGSAGQRIIDVETK